MFFICISSSREWWLEDWNANWMSGMPTEFEVLFWNDQVSLRLCRVSNLLDRNEMTSTGGTTRSSSRAVAARRQKKTTLEEDGSGDWGTIFWSNYYWSCQHFGVVIGAPLFHLITIEAANIWGKLFLSRRLFIMDMNRNWWSSRSSDRFENKRMNVWHSNQTETGNTQVHSK